ncbi:MAG: hypothetical protein FJZ00_00555 [Candidatus Sericytochromatia bacterium]|uniref:PsbP C-terminal domain-containing protein n=1 Tax=Candidatus Tanganyikabacteria bacterium TaxID=2961651 RepID=A0A937X090_9BACT|nr:hypothetical protein [Candidatus Tanganyikabacteria bacterium]
MSSKRAFIAFAAVFALVGCPTLTTGQTSKAGTKATADFADPGGQFTIKYPADWKQSPGSANQVVFFEATLNLPEEAAVGVIVATVTAGVDPALALTQYSSTYASQMKSQGETIHATSSATIAGEKAQTVDHSIKVQGKSFKSRQTIFIKNDKAYQLNFLVAPPEKFDEWVPTNSDMAETLKILK